LDPAQGGPWHVGVHALVRDLNRNYKTERALHAQDFDLGGFQWLAVDDHAHSVFAFLRRAPDSEAVIVVSNFTPVPRPGYRLGVPEPGRYVELVNTDSTYYGGSNTGNVACDSDPVSAQGQPHSIVVTIPPLATVYLRRG
ncbi:MAG TPA: alpha amylase C-terminal domain-containing protein, partial [Chitinolyticbacter sp.]|nr:alpha amylase C-terminal domain-containing protein [Chitinolyticbacter sp.]